MSRLELLAFKLTVNLNYLCLVLQVDTRIVICSRFGFERLLLPNYLSFQITSPFELLLSKLLFNLNYCCLVLQVIICQISTFVVLF
jgi:hypothetical protein